MAQKLCITSTDIIYNCQSQVRTYNNTKFNEDSFIFEFIERGT